MSVPLVTKTRLVFIHSGGGGSGAHTSGFEVL